MNNDSNENKLTPSKKSILAFVKDVAQLEQDEFTLRTITSELRHKATSDINTCESELNRLYSEEKRIKETLLYSQNEKSLIKNDMEKTPQYPTDLIVLTKPEEPKYPDEIVQWQKSKEPHTYISKVIEEFNNFNKPEPKLYIPKITLRDIIGSILIGTIAYFILIFGPVAAILLEINCSVTTFIISLVISYLLTIAVVFALFIKIDKSSQKESEKEVSEYKEKIHLKDLAIEYKEKCSTYQKELSKYNLDQRINEAKVKAYWQNFEECERRNSRRNSDLLSLEQRISNSQTRLEALKGQIQQAIKNKEDAYIKSGYLYAQADLIEEKAIELEQNKLSLYNLGIVPPSYRKLEAVAEIHNIFLNDQADTMREATLLYDTRVFRGELITGIGNIYRMLGNLASSMHAIESRLTEVRNEVRVLNTELYSISDNLVSIKNNSDVNTSQQKQLNCLLRDIAANKQDTKTNFVFSSTASNLNNNSIDATNYDYLLLKQTLLENNKAIEFATNAFLNSSTKQQWYIDQYRQGLL